MNSAVVNSSEQKGNINKQLYGLLLQQNENDTIIQTEYIYTQWAIKKGAGAY